MEEKTFDKLFNEYDALDMYSTTVEQRRHVHHLYENLGGRTSVSTLLRDTIVSTLSRDTIVRKDNPWNYHLYVDTKYTDRPELRGVITNAEFVHKLKFKPYQWWIERLSGKKYFDNTLDSPTDTYLDQQLKHI